MIAGLLNERVKVMSRKQTNKRGVFALCLLIACLLLCACEGKKDSEPASSGISRAAEHTFENCTGGVRLVSCGSNYDKEENVLIPDTYEGKPVVIIGEAAFSGMNMKTVTIPDSVTTIESRAFKNCRQLVNVAFGQNVIYLNGEAFQYCTSLRKIEIPSGVTLVRGNTFEGCSALTDVELHDGITEIHAYAFKGCKSLVEIRLPSSITEIRANTFENCMSLQSIDIPMGVDRIAAHAFRNCASLSSVNIPSTVREIGSSAFRECKKLRAVTVPRGADVNERAFKDSPTKITYQ